MILKIAFANYPFSLVLIRPNTFTTRLKSFKHEFFLSKFLYSIYSSPLLIPLNSLIPYILPILSQSTNHETQTQSKQSFNCQLGIFFSNLHITIIPKDIHCVLSSMALTWRKGTFSMSESR